MTLLPLLPFPPLLWWQGALAGGCICFDEAEPFRKMGLRNRYRIASSNGPLWLTVPILGGREQRRPTGEILIDNRTPWQRTHWRSIGSVYQRTAFFEHYEEVLRPLFEQPFERLSDFNRATIHRAEKVLRLSLPVVENIPGNTAFTDLRERVVDYKSGREKPYVQPFVERTGFLPGMSILDGLFCEGPALSGRFL